MHRRVVRVITLAMALTLLVLAECGDSPRNPFYDPANVDLTFIVTEPTDSVYRTFDTVWCRVVIHLPYLLDSLVIDGTDSLHTIDVPDDDEIVDFSDSLALVFPVPDTLEVSAIAYINDGTVLTAVDTAVIHGQPPHIVEIPSDTLRVAEGATCSISVVVEGDGPFTFDWMKDGVSAGSDSVMVLAGVTQEEAGTYRCIVSSPWGATETNAIPVAVHAAVWVAAPSGVQVISQSPNLLIVWDAVTGAESYRVYHNPTPYDESGGYREVTSAYFTTDTAHTGNYYWVRSVTSDTVSAPSDTVYLDEGVPPVENTPPYWREDTLRATAAVGDTVCIRFDSLCIDPDQGDSLLFSLTGDSSSVSMTDSLLIIAPGTQDTGEHVFYVWASDGDTATDLVVLLAVALTMPSNGTPQWVGDTLRAEITEGDTLLLRLDSLCIDPDSGDTVRFALTEQSGPIAMRDSVIVLMSGARDSGLCTVTVTASDGRDSSSAVLLLRITPNWLVLNTTAGNGSITALPSAERYRWGDTVTLISTPTPPYETAGWTGDTTAAGDTLTLVLFDDMSVTAVFQLPSGACMPLSPGASLNEAIRVASGAADKPKLLCPQPGFYDQQTIRSYGTIRITIE